MKNSTHIVNDIVNDVIISGNKVYIEHNNTLLFIGIIPDNEVSWFQSTIVDETEINKVVYLEEGVYSIKRLMTELQEFDFLSKHKKEHELINLLKNKNETNNKQEDVIVISNVVTKEDEEDYLVDDGDYEFMEAINYISRGNKHMFTCLERFILEYRKKNP